MDMPVGKGRSSISQAGVRKDQVQRDQVMKVLDWGDKNKSIYAKVLRVQADTGWHTTEMMRFRARGTIEDVPDDARDPGMVGVLVCPQHKSGKEHRTKVTQTTLDAARALLDSGVKYRGTGNRVGSLSRSNYEKWVTEGCAAVGVLVFRPSWMRHTIATLASNRGYRDAVGAFLGHAPGSRMVDTHYAPKAVPPRVPTLLDEVPDRDIIGEEDAPPAVGRSARLDLLQRR